jgi:chromosome segregation ATPase
MKIEIPDELRSRIETFLADNKSEQEASAAGREKLAGELAELETEAAKLAGQIPQLRAAALKNSADTAAFQNAETRQRLIAERLNELREQLENIRPVSLALAESILTDAVGFYIETLPPMIMDALAPFCPTPSAARRLVKFTDAVVQLRSVQNFATRLIRLPANPGVFARVEAILQRALRGEPLLFGDVAETEAGQ